ncbi:hypothetical protein D3C73_1533910 [compost metagenome]
MIQLQGPVSDSSLNRTFYLGYCNMSIDIMDINICINIADGNIAVPVGERYRAFGVDYL